MAQSFIIKIPTPLQVPTSNENPAQNASMRKLLTSSYKNSPTKSNIIKNYKLIPC